MSIKDFDQWNEVKKKLDSQNTSIRFFREREMWWCSLGLNIGFEHDGKGSLYQRPVLILKVLSRCTCIIIPLTSSQKRHRYRINVGNIKGVQASAVLSQIKTIDSRRLTERIGYLDIEIFEQIGKSVKELL